MRRLLAWSAAGAGLGVLVTMSMGAPLYWRGFAMDCARNALVFGVAGGALWCLGYFLRTIFHEPS